MSDDNIDLYAPHDLSIIDAIFENSQEIQRDSETDEIFNDVVTSRINEDKEVAINVKVLTLGHDSLQNDNNEDRYEEKEICHLKYSRKYVAYVGNLTWWTTDLDIENLLKSVGVDDLIEVKFFENRGNGQSKGYCSVSVRSDASLKLIHGKLHTKEIHERKPHVAAPSKTAIAQFESHIKPRPCPQSNQGTGPITACGPSNANFVPVMGMPPGFGMSGPPCNRMPNSRGPVMGVGPPPSALSPSVMRPIHPHPSQQHFSPQRPPMQPHNARMHYRPHHQQPVDRCAHPLNVGFGMGQPGAPPRGEWMRPLGPGHPFPPYAPPPPMHHSSHRPPVLPPPHVGSPSSVPGPCPAPAPHANPAFYQPPFSCPPDIRPPGVMGKGMGSPIPMTGTDGPQQQRRNEFSSPLAHENHRKVVASPMTDAEIEDIMSRNRTVSSSAISRAVADAGAGDFASAIETLVTAISLIRQSKVAHEDRCRILITSLQDTLHGIEYKSYGSHRGNRVRYRSRSRERSRTHKYRYHRRSVSRDRETYTRSRSHERHIEVRNSRSSSRGHEIERSIKIDERDRYRDRERHERSHRTGRYHDEERDPEFENRRMHR